MSDKIELKINGYVFSRWINYRFGADLYQAARSFEITVARTMTFTPRAGMKCEIYINDKVEMIGVIDRAERGYSASGRIISLSGRDLAGILVDTCTKKFGTIQNKSAIEVAELLMKDIPLITSIEYDELAEGRDASKPKIQIEPGQRIFDVLCEVCVSRGLIFYTNSRGSLVLRKPRGRGRVLYSIGQNADTINNLVVSGSYTEDISSRYSEYTVLTQEQSRDETDPVQINDSATVKDDEFPAFVKGFYKAFIMPVNDDKTSVKKLVTREMEKQRMLSSYVSYTVRGHAQNNNNWAVDELVRVKDKELDVDDTLLVYGRDFYGSSSGQFTGLRIGVPGLVV